MARDVEEGANHTNSRTQIHHTPKGMAVQYSVSTLEANAFQSPAHD